MLDVGRARRRWEPIIAAGGWPCCTCHRPIAADDDWALDDIDEAVALPRHARCGR